MIGAGGPRDRACRSLRPKWKWFMQPTFAISYTPTLKRLAAVLAMAVALAACARDLPAQSAPAAAPAQAAGPAPDAGPAVADAVVRALPDFTQLVDRYGPAVVNVEVVEKPQAGGGAGLSPDDPLYDFFHRFGVPAP